MAKCVVCTTLNANSELKKHPNISGGILADCLERRWNNTSKRERNRYCPIHGGTGRPTVSDVRAMCEIDSQREGTWKRKDA